MPFFQKRGWSGESAERLPWASEREREDGRETELPRGLRGCILQEEGEGVFVSRWRFLRVKYHHAARPGWDLLLGRKRDTDQHQLGQVTRLGLMLVDVFSGRWRGEEGRQCAWGQLERNIASRAAIESDKEGANRGTKKRGRKS